MQRDIYSPLCLVVAEIRKACAGIPLRSELGFGCLRGALGSAVRTSYVPLSGARSGLACCLLAYACSRSRKRRAAKQQQKLFCFSRKILPPQRYLLLCTIFVSNGPYSPLIFWIFPSKKNSLICPPKFAILFVRNP